MIQVGDLVRFKSWKELERKFGTDSEGNILCGFTKRMKPLCGLEAKVSNMVYLLGLYEVKLADNPVIDKFLDNNRWVTISTDMLKKVRRRG